MGSIIVGYAFLITIIIMLCIIIVKNNSKHWRIVNKIQDINLDTISKLKRTEDELLVQIKRKNEYFQALTLLRVKQHRTTDNVRNARISRDEWRKKYEYLLKIK